jgi:three-Cys-motif partner protein
MDNKKIPWEIEPHTQAKLAILQRYLQPWFAILSSSHDRVIYLDGFSGPGEYIYKGKNVNGSPLIAIETYLRHTLKKRIKEIVFIFIEKELKVFQYLEKKLEPYKKQGLKIETKNDEFENVVNAILDELSQSGDKIAPTFCFIDPFGIKGLPMSSVERIMENKSCEVLINFMYEDLNRFISLPQNERHVTELFGGSEEWKKVQDIQDPQKRYFFLTSLYEKRLRSQCGECYIRTFDMINQHNKNDYVLFFVTKNKLGLEKMKEAMWKVDDTGNFKFSDVSYNPEQVTFLDAIDYSKLKRMILDKYAGDKISIEELSDFVLIETPFLPKSHLKTPVLKPMEENGEIKVYGTRKRKGTFPDRIIIGFTNIKQSPNNSR